MKEQQVNSTDPGFGVEIRSGRRAVAVETPKREPVPDRPTPGGTGAARKDRNRSLGLAAAGIFALLIALLVGWQWWTTRVPEGVWARINGENISVEQVDREISLSRMLGVLVNGQEPDPLPSRSSTLESLLNRRMKAQDATRAGIVVSDEDMNKEVVAFRERNSISEDDLGKALTSYKLTMADMINILRDTTQINRYIAKFVIAGAATRDEASQKVNDWEIQLQRTSQVERFADPYGADVPKVGHTGPGFQLTLLQPGATTPATPTGATPVPGVDYLALESLRGRPVIVNFWATWCQPCRIELPELQQAYKQYEDTSLGPNAGLAVLGVLVDSDPDVALKFQNEYGLTFPILIDAAGQVKDLYRIGPIPTSYFIDRAGVIQYVKVGMLEKKELEEKIALISK